MIHVSGELLAMFLRGETLAAEPLNVPADLTIIGTVAENPPQMRIAILCGSDEWEGFCNERGEYIIFDPTFRTLP